MFDIRDMTQQRLPWTGLSIWLVLIQMSRLKFTKKWTSYLVSPLQYISEQMQLKIKNILTSVVKWSTAKHIWFVIGGSDRPASMNDLKEMRYLECCIKVKYKIISIRQPHSCGIFIDLLLSVYSLLWKFIHTQVMMIILCWSCMGKVLQYYMGGTIWM